MPGIHRVSPGGQIRRDPLSDPRGEHVLCLHRKLHRQNRHHRPSLPHLLHRRLRSCRLHDDDPNGRRGKKHHRLLSLPRRAGFQDQTEIPPSLPDMRCHLSCRRHDRRRLFLASRHLPGIRDDLLLSRDGKPYESRIRSRLWHPHDPHRPPCDISRREEIPEILPRRAPSASRPESRASGKFFPSATSPRSGISAATRKTSS